MYNHKHNLIILGIMKTKYYFDELPEDYEEVYTIDAKNKKTIIIFNVIALLIMIAVIIPVIIYAKAFFDENENLFEMLLPIILVLPSMFIYIVLHELTHGLFYKIFTHEKLTFGLTMTVAYCGVPNLYVKKWPAFLTTLAPFLIWNLIFGLPLFFVKGYQYILFFGLLFSMHVSGCIGDLIVGGLLLFKFRGSDYLINDTGPKQTFYKRISE